MTKLNYDPILGCTGWDFKAPPTKEESIIHNAISFVEKGRLFQDQYNRNFLRHQIELVNRREQEQRRQAWINTVFKL